MGTWIITIFLALVFSVWFTLEVLKELEKKRRRAERGINTWEDWEKSLNTIWNGPPTEMEFTYESDNGINRRRVLLNRVAKNEHGKVYFFGHCYLRGENRTFRMDNIKTTIKHNDAKYYHVDFLTDVLNINPKGLHIMK